MPGSDVASALSMEETPWESTEDVCDSSSDADIVPSSSTPDVPAGWHEAEFILKIKEQYSLTQVAVDQTTKMLMKDVFSSVLDSLKEHLTAKTLSLLSERMNTASTSLFSGLSSAYLQNKYFKEHFKLVVSKYLYLAADLSAYIQCT